MAQKTLKSLGSSSRLRNRDDDDREPPVFLEPFRKADHGRYGMEVIPGSIRIYALHRIRDLGDAALRAVMDRFGPRVFVSAVLCGVGWAGLGHASTLTELYPRCIPSLASGQRWLCSSTTVGLKWFPDKLGLASGLIAAGFVGAALF